MDFEALDSGLYVQVGAIAQVYHFASRPVPIFFDSRIESQIKKYVNIFFIDFMNFEKKAILSVYWALDNVLEIILPRNSSIKLLNSIINSETLVIFGIGSF